VIRTLLIAASLAGLGCVAACNGNGPEGNTYYQIGDANYDALKAADDACKAKAGTFSLKKGGDPTHLGDYECVAPTAKGSS
jgi:hypothetical protein